MCIIVHIYVILSWIYKGFCFFFYLFLLSTEFMLHLLRI